MTTDIRDFWFSNPEYWITTGPNQAIADKLIHDKFRNYDYKTNDTLGQVIYLDQFIRHFSRIEAISEETVLKCREQAAALVQTVDLNQANEKELVCYLMPWKHLCEWHPIFHTINESPLNLKNSPFLNRFFTDTYRKAYRQNTIASRVLLSTKQSSYDPSLICELHPPKDSWASNYAHTDLVPVINEPVTISLSGGVDSMLLTALLVKTNTNLIATHIVYGNRPESAHECAFIQSYCEKLNVPLYIYKIEWLRRDSVDRAFYETMTRDIRFSVYKTLNRPVILGHIQEDVVENIWTNLARGTHLNDLAKLAPRAVESGVTILRPWLQVKKQQIYDLAHAMNIPYLKNTTPVWSNRGKFRNDFYEATHAQYGSNVDSVLIEVADRYKTQATLLDKLLYNNISDSWNPVTRQLDVTSALDIDLDADGWQRILTDVAHSKLSIGKPTLASCIDFKERVKRGLKDKMKISLSKRFVITIVISGPKTYISI